MLKSCQYCGRIHDTKYVCGMKPKHNAIKKKSTQNDFRSTKAWQKKRDQIRERDKNLCQVCIRNMYSTLYQYNYKNLSVHHCISLEEDYSKRLDDDNLITLCSTHHEYAENGVIPRNVIQKIIDEQEEKARKVPPEG